MSTTTTTSFFEEEEKKKKKKEKLFLPYETLANVFAIIDTDDSKTISGEEFLSALRKNTGNVSEILDLAREGRGKTKTNEASEFALACQIIAQIGSCGERGVELSQFVEAFRMVEDANEEEEEEEEEEDAGGCTRASSSGELKRDEEPLRLTSTSRSSESPMNESSSIERTNKVDAVRAAILQKRENVEELKRTKRMTTLVAEACKSLVRKNLKKKEQRARRKEGLMKFIPRVKNLKNIDNNSESDDSESESEASNSRRSKGNPNFLKASLTMIAEQKNKRLSREKKIKKILKQKMSPEMKALNDELYVNAFMLLDIFKDLNYSGTGLIIVDGFMHVYERNKLFGQDLWKARVDTSSHSTFDQDMARTAMEMGGRRRESVDIVSFLSYFCRANSTFRPKLPPLPDIPMNDGMVSPAKMSVEGSSRQRRNILEAKIGIGSGMFGDGGEGSLNGASVKSESIKDINEVVPMSEGIAQHLKLTPMKTPKALTSAMKKMKMREENKEDEKEKSARQRIDFNHPSSSSFENKMTKIEENDKLTLAHLDSKASTNTEKNYRILSMVLNEDDRLEEMEGDEDDENEQANLRGLEMEALIHILSMREMNKVHQ